ncbi:metal ABC transporter substrate-binding protein [Bacillus pumilus]|uniref:metal ABC transporter substrate-binding protein n=1 Tax=Bacillus pumilus TaxID=1408 RepID=UPI00119DEE1A|nr:metal ABC transporter substrate-binding protein [Bacillus pumilus]MBU8696225.1 metal ABC transporter substrate-binding protein [Bacillus pumilus]
MKKVFAIRLTAVFIALMIITGCSTKQNNSGKDDGTLKVVTTYSILYDIVKEVGGEHVSIHSIVPIGTDPHEFDPLPKDVQHTTDADLVLYNGLNLETGNGWFQKLLESSGKDGDDAPVAEMSKGVKVKHLSSKGLESQQDPHAWLNVENGILYAKNARDALIKADPEHQEDYEKNAEVYIKKLQTLHNEAKDKFDQLPKDKKRLVTSEGAFKYFADAYGLKAGYIWEINTENEGTPGQMKRIIHFVKDHQVPALFLETSVDQRSLESLSEETGVPIKGKVFTDSIGKKGEDGDSYYKMMKWNIDTIYKGLSS